MSTLLRNALGGQDPEPLVWQARITAIAADGTVSIDLGLDRGITVALVLDTYTPVVGDVVQVLRRDATSWLVLGGRRASSPSTVDVTTSLAFPYNVVPAAPGVADPLVVSAATLRSWRDAERWSDSAPVAPEATRAAQGALSTAFGYYRGCYFYGASAFSSILGRVCTSITIRLHRTSGGSAATEPMWIAPHVHPSQPTVAPFFPVAAVNVGSLAPDGIGTFSLPLEWGQKVLDGVYKGFGHLSLSTADYAICHALGTDSASGQLSIGWD